MLARMRPPEFPAALGIIRSVKRSTFDTDMISQIEYEKEKGGYKNVNELLFSGDTWEV
jgi:hypothetical protein